MIRFYKPTIKRKDMDCVLQTMVDEEIGSGTRTTNLIASFCEKTSCYIGTAYRTYLDAIICALKILNVDQETKVGISPFSPSIYSEALKALNVNPVYIDVDKENGCPDSAIVNEKGIEVLVLYETQSTLPMKYNPETTFAEKVEYPGVKILEDVSSSLGSHVLEEAKAGDWGNVVICSMEEDDLVPAGGGAVVAVKSSYAQQLRENRPDKYHAMTDLNSSLALIQLDNLEDNSAKRRDVIKTYQQSLSRTVHKQFGLMLIDYQSSSFSFPVFLDCKPDEIISFAKKHDVPVIRTFEDSIVSSYEGDLFESLPVAAAFIFRTVSFPVYPFLKDSDIEVIRKIISHLP